MNLLDTLYIPAAVVTAPWWARKTRAGWGERFGRIPALPEKTPGVPRVLLHAVSVGEVNTLRSLVPMLRQAGVEVVVSVSTDTGLARAKAIFEDQQGGSGVYVVRYPLDLSSAVERFFTAVRPDAVALVELEVWPNFVSTCSSGDIPIGVINGRLSARSFRGYSKIRPFLRSTFASLSFVCAQDEEIAARFVSMGVPKHRVTITGSMKWDAAPIANHDATNPASLALARDLGIDQSRPLVVAGSTASMGKSCEESLLHAACPPGVQLLCAPRRPEHCHTAFAALGGPGRCVRRSQPESRDAVPAAERSRFLLDTIGELRAAYGLADVVVIGRTFAELGGSDPIEPISLGKPTIVGPHTSNFASVVRAFRSAPGGPAIVECTAETLAESVRLLLKSPAEREQLVARGTACIREHQGATRRHAERVLACVRASSASPHPQHD